MPPSLLLVTDPAYPAPGRRYGDEGIPLASRLRDEATRDRFVAQLKTALRQLSDDSN